MERSDLEDARVASDSKTLSQRTEEAVAWYLVTLAEIARRVQTEAELKSLMDADRPISLTERWAELHGR